MREKLTKCGTTWACQLKYKSAGKIEFLAEYVPGDLSFLEMNTRLQVEHGITEMCYKVDLVKLMLQQADCERVGHTLLPSESLTSLQNDGPDGTAIEARAY
jgi:acetyl/propionyl-CoA carboxylase alpha subunit